MTATSPAELHPGLQASKEAPEEGLPRLHDLLGGEGRFFVVRVPPAVQPRWEGGEVEARSRRIRTRVWILREHVELPANPVLSGTTFDFKAFELSVVRGKNYSTYCHMQNRPGGTLHALR